MSANSRPINAAAIEPYAPGPKLTPEQKETLRGHGQERALAAGGILFRANEPYDFSVVLEGLIELVDDLGGLHEMVVSQRFPGHFIGELGVLKHQTVPLNAVAREPSRVLTISSDALRSIIDTEPALSEIILRAFLDRRGKLIQSGRGPTVVGSRYSDDTQRILEFLARNRVPFKWLDLERDTDAEEVLARFQVSTDETPIVVCGEQVLRNPSNEELARVAGFVPSVHPGDVFDLIVVGAGPAGLGAAVYGASEGLTTLALEGSAVGRQASTSSRIENYLGFPAGLSGAELTVRASLQAEKFHARFSMPCSAVQLHSSNGMHTFRVSSGEDVLGRSVIIATGAHYRRLSVPRLNEFEGMGGVYYAATIVEANTCGGSQVALVGGGNSAGQAALYLSKSCVRVFVIIRGSSLDETMSRYLIDEICERPNIEVITESEVRELIGDTWIEGIEIEHKSGTRRRLDVRALFVFIGADPQTAWLNGQLAADEHGFILTGHDLPADRNGASPAALETRRVSPESSPPAMCAAAPSSAWRRQSGRVPWPSISYIAI